MSAINNKEAKSNYLPLLLKNRCLGKIHSKFNNGFNIEFDHSLIYISFAGTPLSAFGLNLNEEKLRGLLNSIKIGDAVVNKNGKFIFYTIDEIISISYWNIEEIDLRIPKINCSIRRISETKLYNCLLNTKFDELIGIELDGKTKKYVDLLLSSDKSDLNINSRIIEFFSGRGRGLTPSGDDILIGFTLSLIVFDKFDNWVRALKSGINEKTTTIISVAYLGALLEGYASEHFIELIKLLDEDDINKIEEIIKRVQSFGHTSGNDTLLGFFLGLKYLIN